MLKQRGTHYRLQVPGRRKSNEFYQELLDLGVVNSHVQLGTRNLLEDVDFGGTLNKLNSDWGLKRLLKGLNKIKKRCTRLHTQQKMTFGKYLHILEKNLN